MAPRSKLGDLQATYQIALPITVVNEIPRIASSVIGERISFPVGLVGRVLAHEVLQLLYIYTSAVDAIAKAQDHVDILYKPVETI